MQHETINIVLNNGRFVDVVEYTINEYICIHTYIHRYSQVGLKIKTKVRNPNFLPDSSSSHIYFNYKPKHNSAYIRVVVSGCRTQGPALNSAVSSRQIVTLTWGRI